MEPGPDVSRAHSAPGASGVRPLVLVLGPRPLGLGVIHGLLHVRGGGAGSGPRASKLGATWAHLGAQCRPKRACQEHTGLSYSWGNRLRGGAASLRFLPGQPGLGSSSSPGSSVDTWAAGSVLRAAVGPGRKVSTPVHPTRPCGQSQAWPP